MKQRLFIAALLTDAQERELQRLQSVIRAASTKASLTLSQNLHLTLRFLGDCDDDQTEGVKQILRLEKSRQTEPLLTRIVTVGRFSGRDGELVFARLEVAPALDQLVSALEQRLIKNGFPAERKKWLPHVTLARRVTFKEVEPAFPISQNQAMVPLHAIHLFRSEFTGAGMKYTVLY